MVIVGERSLNRRRCALITGYAILQIGAIIVSRFVIEKISVYVYDEPAVRRGPFFFFSRSDYGLSVRCSAPSTNPLILQAGTVYVLYVDVLFITWAPKILWTNC